MTWPGYPYEMDTPADDWDVIGIFKGIYGIAVGIQWSFNDQMDFLGKLLVAGFNPSEKSWSSSMGRMTSHVSWKIKFMFENTNQNMQVYNDTINHI